MKLIKDAVHEKPTDPAAPYTVLFELGLITRSFDPTSHGTDCESYDSALVDDVTAAFFDDESFGVRDGTPSGTPSGTSTGHIAKAVCAKSLSDQLSWICSASYKKTTKHHFTLLFLQFLETMEHEGFMEPGWMAADVFAKWQNLHGHRVALRERYGSGSINSYPILPAHAAYFLNDYHKKKLSKVQGQGGRPTKAHHMLSHGSVLQARAGLCAIFPLPLNPWDVTHPTHYTTTHALLRDPTQI